MMGEEERERRLVAGFRYLRWSRIGIGGVGVQEWAVEEMFMVGVDDGEDEEVMTAGLEKKSRFRLWAVGCWVVEASESRVASRSGALREDWCVKPSPLEQHTLSRTTLVNPRTDIQVQPGMYSST